MSLYAVAAAALETAEGGPHPQNASEIILALPVETASPVFDDLIPAPPTPAPVAISEEDARPLQASVDIPTPAAVTFTQGDVLRGAIMDRLANDTAMRELRLNAKDREALTAFYTAAAQPTLWSRDGAFLPAAQGVAAILRDAGNDGLDPADYPLPSLSLAKDAPPAAWAEADLKLSVAAIRYARDARGGRIDPARLSNLIAPTLDLPAIEAILSALVSTPDAGVALADFNPPHEGYRALKAKLAQLRENNVPRPVVHVPKGPTLRLGMRDPRVPLIRARFNLGPSSGDETAYDHTVVSAVSAFQKEKGLPTSGDLTAQTVAALDPGTSAARLEGDLIANMERWRWLPRDLGTRHIFVNVPEYRLRFVQDKDVIHETRVIVGKKESQTPIFSDEMKYLVVNPSWTVPPSIMKKEFLPALASDPTYAARKGYKVIRNGNRISVQQPPGERNALGYVKFMFPNQYAVYLHDTPNRKLFSAQDRAFSHGCVRVDQPFQLAQEVLESQGWNEQKLRGLIGKGERYIHLREPLPVHLTYFTLSSDETGEMKTFEDLYGLNRKVRAALGLDG
ncbi:L,D-transpeptidase family protein [Microvirga flavescens]|uniref:L,D-transpeptidase family protein n=1 Tax=Microvirga flavescens TaxID=2249811 RepID=UPI001FE0F8AC|nr:L,D-transpeptidase family protein [Microvirga flavescens]